MDAHARTTIEIRPSEPLAVEFTSSWHHEGNTLIDEFSTVESIANWIVTYRDRLGMPPSSPLLVAHSDPERVVEAREAVRELLDSAVDENRPGAAALRLINKEAHRIHAAILVWTPNGPHLRWPPGTSTTDQLVSQVCASTVRVLGSPRRHLLRRCPAPRCVLFFSALRTGQMWCSQACGNRARVARHSARSQ
ncbi:ABATE domain-containing protein [Streptomyces brevispora]|uniref:CGNR zinc finger domain-containing protein n=1 Tax=Streptomyces brevispora TaxID=887462 RepID=UPI002E34CED8|nr:ABATE domain-containing protein [Streptomyces brevispora]